jgi:integrase
MTAAEAAALLVAAKDHPRLGVDVILSLTTGIRTEEARALRWYTRQTPNRARISSRVIRCSGGGGPSFR